MGRFLVVLNEAPYGSERAYNALRLAINIIKKDEKVEVRVFLVGDASSCAKAGQLIPQGYYNIEIMLKSLARHGVLIGICGACMDARGIKDEELVEGAHRSSLDEWTEWSLWAEKVLTF